MTQVLKIAAVVLGVALSAPANADTHVVHFTAHDQETRRYAYVPIEVPSGVTRITIEYRYRSESGANVIDLGLFEPGPLTRGTPAFRGWSGGARNRITLGVAEATPGYWPGPIPEGTWHVMFGLYRVASGGVDVEMTVELSRTATGPPASHPYRPVLERRFARGRPGTRASCTRTRPRATAH